MKKISSLFVAVVALLAISLTSCDERARLGKSVMGEWTSGVEQLAGVTSAVTANITETIAFLPDPSSTDTKSGTFVISSMCDITMAPPFDGQLVESVSKSVAAQTSVEGTWSAIDDDELALNFDMQSLTVNVDTASVALNQNMITNTESPQIESVSARNASALSAQLTSALRARYSSMRMLKDVEVKGTVLKYEVGDVDYMLTRDSQ